MCIWNYLSLSHIKSDCVLSVYILSSVCKTLVSPLFNLCSIGKLCMSKSRPCPAVKKLRRRATRFRFLILHLRYHMHCEKIQWKNWQIYLLFSGLGIRSSVFQAIRLFFVSDLSIAHSRSFVQSKLSDSIMVAL